MPLLTAKEWESFAAKYANVHILQTCAWGELKQAFGWQVKRVAVTSGVSGVEAGAQVLFRRLPFGLSVAYIPRGPVGPQDFSPAHALWNPLIAEIDALCRKQRSIFLKIEPDLWQPLPGETDGSLDQLRNPPQGFQNSPEDIQPARTLLIDICGDEAEVLARMKQKTRYNIRLAQKKGVVVEKSSDIGLFHQLMQSTGQRDAFGVHSLEYYHHAYQLFQPGGSCELLVAAYQGEPLAAVMVFAKGQRAWYFYGASSNEHRDLMPSYLVQWEAIRWARSRGCQSYDLWGVPDEDEETLESNFLKHNTGLWGVYRFKRGFGGVLRRTQGPWDRVYQRSLYSAYRWWMSRKN